MEDRGACSTAAPEGFVALSVAKLKQQDSSGHSRRSTVQYSSRGALSEDMTYLHEARDWCQKMARTLQQIATDQMKEAAAKLRRPVFAERRDSHAAPRRLRSRTPTRRSSSPTRPSRAAGMQRFGLRLQRRRRVVFHEASSTYCRLQYSLTQESYPAASCSYTRS